MNTTPLCGHCGRPVMADGRMAGLLVYHYECTLSPNARTFQPPSLTGDQVRQIVREELERAHGVARLDQVATADSFDGITGRPYGGQIGAPKSLPKWTPCNEGCDPACGGFRTQYCKCPAANAALGVARVQPQQAVQCAFCERPMIAGSECLTADRAAACEVRTTGVALPDGGQQK